jgi:hypothetical protein
MQTEYDSGWSADAVRCRARSWLCGALTSPVRLKLAHALQESSPLSVGARVRLERTPRCTEASTNPAGVS